ncbi:lysozyme family protein [Methylovulum miyakonense]|uniref:hypothetical protein n=1 Tax=Methylovulum miyakonense TaxID=645578 RepID=UPI00036515DC|nr:hypothetical protein [Methylovulum miyakonense]
MKRREFLKLSMMAPFILKYTSVFASTNFEQLLSQFENNDDELLENSWQFREGHIIQTKGIGTGQKSTRKISETAIDMIVKLEVGGKNRYEKYYQTPIWPKSNSGVTIGIGYDLGYADKNVFYRDWCNRLEQPALSTLEKVLKKKGNEAKDSLPTVADVVKVSWDAAYGQFIDYIPFVTYQTEKTFPHCDELSADCLGALVSLVFNRGTDLDKQNNRRKEMLDIRNLMRNRKFENIPDRIRSMKRIWENNPDAKGLVIRRELEAKLFESGLKSIT